MPSQTGSIDLTAQVSANNNAKDYSDNVVDSLEIGGRNLLLNSKLPIPTLAPYSNSVTSKYNTPSLDGVDYYYCSGTRYWRIDFPTLISGETYNLWFDIARSSDSKSVFVKIGSTEQNIGTALARAWKRLGLSFVASTATYAEIRVAIDSTGTQNNYIAALRNVKLEKGDKATDWTPAPEDVDASISSAAQTATNYITADANGISIHMANESNTYQHQTSNSTTFYVGGKKRSQVGADGLHVYVDSTEDEVASFGATARIGYADDFRTVIGPGRINMLDGTKRLIGIASGKIKMGQYGSFEVTDTGFNGYGRDGGKYVSLAVNGTGMTRHFTAKIEVEDGETFTSYSFPTASTHTQNLYVAVDGVEQVESTDYTFIETAPAMVTVDGAYIQEGGYAGTVTFPRHVYGPATINVEYDREVYGYDMHLGLEEYTNFSVNEDEALFTSKDGSRVSFDYHSLRMVDREGAEYFHVSDLRDEDGYFTEEFNGNGSTVSFPLSVVPTVSTISVTVNGVVNTNWYYTAPFLTLTSAPPNNAVILAKYQPSDTDKGLLKAFTYGTRRNGNHIGPYSFAAGHNVSAWSICSVAFGLRASANSSYAFAEGCDTKASGIYSHAQNHNTIAAYEAQTAIGKYNNNQSANAFEIGNGTSDNARSNAATIDWNGNYIGQAMAGIIQMFAGATPPTGWLLCHGQAISRTDYATLFAAIGTTWGSGDGSTTFNVPDLRGRAPIGAGTGSGLTARTLAAKGGSENIQAHTHAFTQPTVKTELKFQKNAASGSAINRVAGSNLSNPAETSTYTATVTGGAVGAVSGASTGTAGNMPPFAVINFIICTGKTS